MTKRKWDEGVRRRPREVFLFGNGHGGCEALEGGGGGGLAGIRQPRLRAGVSAGNGTCGPLTGRSLFDGGQGRSAEPLSTDGAG